MRNSEGSLDFQSLSEERLSRYLQRYILSWHSTHKIQPVRRPSEFSKFCPTHNFGAINPTTQQKIRRRSHVVCFNGLRGPNLAKIEHRMPISYAH